MADDAEFFDDPFSAYLAELRRAPAMERAEEIACIEHVRAADDMAKAAQKRLVEANLALVVSFAERHRGERLHILDLIQKGNEGLLRAAETLADCVPDSFASYATTFIERALTEAVRSAGLSSG